MPTNHKTYFGENRCPKNPNLPVGYCEPGSRPFEPHTRGPRPTPPTPPNPPPGPTPPGPTPPRPTPPTPDPTPPGPSPDPPPDATKTNDGPVRLIARPPTRLGKKTTVLTDAQNDRAKMVAASYEIDEKVNTIVRNQGESSTAFRDTVSDVMHVYGQDEVDKYGLNDWTIDADESTEQWIVLDKPGETEIVFRGKNGTNPPDNQHLRETLLGRESDYSAIDQMVTNVQKARPNSVIRVVSYSNGGPKGVYVSEKYSFDHYSIDPVLGPKEIRTLASRTTSSPKLEVVTTTRPAMAAGSGLALQEIMTGQRPANSEYLVVEPVKSRNDWNPLVRPMMDIQEAHGELTNYSNVYPNNKATIPASERVPYNSTFNRNTAGELVSSVVPVAIASMLVEQIAPDQQKDAKIAEVAGGGAMLQQIISPILGGGEVAAADLVLPLFTSLEAADKTAQAMDAALPDDMPYADRSVLIGTAAGGAGGGTFAATAAGVTVAKTAAKQAVQRVITSSATASAEAQGYEMVALEETVAAETTTTMGEAALVATGAEAGTEMTALLAAEGGVEAGLVAATELTTELAASELFLNPVLDAMMVGTLTAAAIGATVGLITGQHEHFEDTRKTPEEMADENTAFANSITRLVENNGESTELLPYINDLLKRQTYDQTSREEDAAIAMLQAHRRSNPEVFSRDIGAALDTYVAPAYEGDRQNDLQGVLSDRHQQIRDMVAAEQNRKKTEQMDLRDLLEASRDHPETLSIEDAHTLTHTRSQYENGTLDDYMADIVDKHDSGFWSSDREDQPEIQPAADFSSLAVGASADTVVLHEAG